MAWLIKIRSDKACYQPLTSHTNGCQTWEEMMQADRPFYQEAENAARILGYLPYGIYAAGNTIDARFWPQQGYLMDDCEKLPPLLGLRSFLLVSKEWKDAIEEVEPDKHQFRAVPLYRPNGQRIEGDYSAVNLRAALKDTVEPNLSNAKIRLNADGSKTYLNAGITPNIKVVFRKDRIVGLHCWQPLDLLGYHLACSNELYQRLSKIDGMEAVNALETTEV